MTFMVRRRVVTELDTIRRRLVRYERLYETGASPVLIAMEDGLIRESLSKLSEDEIAQVRDELRYWEKRTR